jgi:hypothetical protein
MDIELLFSRNPFVGDQQAQFSFIKPVLTREIVLPADQTTFSYELPQQFHQANVMIEARSTTATQSQAYYANDMNVRIVEQFGRLDAGIPRVYVKVYARMQNGEVKFFKDGYTDFRGQFDYVSLNTNDLDQVERFAILIMSENNGALVREAAPPKR